MSLEKKFFNRFYQEKPDAYEDNQGLKKISQFHFQRLLKNLRWRTSLKNSCILSIGCGTGRFELKLAPQVKKIIGVDVSEVGISLAKKKNKFANLKFLVASATSLPFKNQEFDIVLSLSAIHHIENQPRLFQELSRVLKRNGLLYAIEPNKKGLLPGLGEKFFKKTYHRIHSPEESSLEITQISRELNQHGFKVCQIQYCDFFFGPLAYLIPWLPRYLLDLVFLVNRLLINLPLIRNFSCEFNLLAVKELP